MLPRGVAADPRVRADDGGDPERLRAAEGRPLPRAPRAGAGQAGVGVPLYITKSNGGVTTARDARRATAETLLSGPASGVIGATASACGPGYGDLITFDMGGTSADIALVRDGQPVYSTDETVGRLPDRHAGRRRVVDRRGRRLDRVAGPGRASSRSGRAARAPTRGRPATAGAAPSRPCPTPSSFAAFSTPTTSSAGGCGSTPTGQRRRCGRSPTALDLGVDAAAEAVIEVATANMYAAFTNVLARHGLDPRDFALVAFGGAGPVEACFLARSSTSRASSCRRRLGRSAPRAR